MRCSDSIKLTLAAAADTAAAEAEAAEDAAAALAEPDAVTLPAHVSDRNLQVDQKLYARER